MNFLKPILPLYCGLAAIYNRCATVTQGTKQQIFFDTSPSGAICTIMRSGKTLYRNVAVPQALQIGKDKDPLVITCEKEGYKEATIDTSSNLQGWTAGNLLIGGGLGIAIDFASGAARLYPDQITILLEKE